MDMNKADLVLSSEGHIYFEKNALAQEVLTEITFSKINELFSHHFSYGLLQLGIQDFVELPAGFLFWQSFVRVFVTKICKLPELSDLKELPLIELPSEDELKDIISQAPFIRGFEYLTVETLRKIWTDLQSAFEQALKNFSGSIQEYLSLYNSRWNLIGRVCFHLAENKNNAARPFAFVATYTTKLSQQTNAQHLPLKRALQDYAGEKNHAALLALLVPVQKSAEKVPLIKKLVDSGDIFQAMTWTVHEAHEFLSAIPEMENSGVMIRVPNWWSSKNPLRPKVNVTIGKNSVSMIGLNSLLDFNVGVSLSNGENLSEKEWQALMNSNENLVKVKGQWVEINKEHLNTVLLHWNELKEATKEGLSLAESLRLLSGSMNVTNAQNTESEVTAQWSNITAGDWLKTLLDQLRDPQKINEKSLEKILKQYLNATLRPYQWVGVNWLWFLYRLKLGACLADDMGLGKTIQILSFLLLVKYNSKTTEKNIPNLLIVPASLIGNWESEITRFSPDITYFILHGSAMSREKMQKMNENNMGKIDLMITTYSFVNKVEWLKKVAWNVIILDEAQLIKNPGAKQTRAIKVLNSQVRFTLTGTPIENRLSDLWSLFDFTSPGLLGTSKSFSTYEKKVDKEKDLTSYKRFMASIRQLTQPYILRRLKSDKKIISDLPDKTEIQTWCSLSKQQIQMYEQSVRDLKNQLEDAEGIKRRGLVLSFLLRFKQICNHPSQWLGYGDYAFENSGKFIRLKEICEEIALKQEKVLVFTQFTEIIPALENFLATIFGCEGLSLHGETPIKKRTALVEAFQQEQGAPFFILSLKAGGTGLTLTRASHVIHFDRWWNPAVENQATDRAYRIGQKHPVMVHKFICRGTIEEKIDSLITSKKDLSQEILQIGNEMSLTELNNDQLIDMISLDIHKALGEG